MKFIYLFYGAQNLVLNLFKRLGTIFFKRRKNEFNSLKKSNICFLSFCLLNRLNWILYFYYVDYFKCEFIINGLIH